MKLFNKQQQYISIITHHSINFYPLTIQEMRRYLSTTTNNKMQSNQQQEEQLGFKKDKKIQQLMMENTQLKRQLSQFISKTSTNQTPLHSGMQSPKYQQLIKPNTAEFNSYLRNSLEQSYDNHISIKPYTNNNNNNRTTQYYTNAVSSPTTSNSNHHNITFQFPTNTNSNNNRISSSPSYNHNNPSSPVYNNNHTNPIYKQTNTRIYNNNNEARLSFNSDVNQSLSQQLDNNRLTIRVSPVKIGCQKHNRSNTHSVDIGENCQLPENDSANNNKGVIMNPANNYQHHRVQKSSITIGQSFGFPTPINQDRQIIYITQNLQPFEGIQSPKGAQNMKYRQVRSIEQQLYREKMMKLKAKKSPKLRQVSQQKTNKSSTPSLISKRCQKVSNNVNNVTNNANKNNTSKSKNTRRSIDKIEQLKKAHEVLKAKLSPSKQMKDNAKMSTMQTQGNQYTKINNNNNNMLEISRSKNDSNRQVNTNRQKSPISKLLSSQSLKTIESTKKLPKYIPKIFSKKQTNQKIEKGQQQLSSTLSIDKVSKKTIEKDEIIKQQKIESNKKVQSRKQVRGLVYLEDESELVVGLQKRQVHKNDSNNSKPIQQQATTKSGPISTNETKRQAVTNNKPKSVKSQQPTDSTRKQSTDESVGEIGRVRMMRRSSNKVYLQEQTTQERKTSNNKRTLIEQRPASTVNNSRDRPPIRARQNNKTTQVRQKISSIEQIHMMSEDCQQQQESTIRQRKQLYNQVYCLEQSKSKIK